MSSDPIIQFPFNGQSWNAYSYLLNNPMSGTDPSGFTLDCELGDPDCGDGSGDPTRRKPKRFINGRAVCQTVFCSIEGFLALLGPYSDHLEPEDNEGGVGRNGLGNVLVSDIGVEVVSDLVGNSVISRTDLLLLQFDEFLRQSSNINNATSTGIASPIRGNALSGFFKGLLADSTPIFNESSSINAFQPDVQDQADIEAFGNTSFAIILPVIQFISPSKAGTTADIGAEALQGLKKKDLVEAMEKALEKMRKGDEKTIDDYMREIKDSKKDIVATKPDLREIEEQFALDELLKQAGEPQPSTRLQRLMELLRAALRLGGSGDG